MKAWRSIALAGVAAVVCGCGGSDKLPREVRSALEEAEVFELYSLEPLAALDAPAAQFYGWKVLGKTVVTDTGTRDQFITALRKGSAATDEAMANCFNPRHGIRVTSGEVTTDLVICFECLWVEVFRAGERVGGFATRPYSEAAFDEVLIAAGVPLAKKAK